MPRLMSVNLTEQAVRDRTKTVTRRLGWKFLKPGDRLTLCRKVQGRHRSDGTIEPLVRLAEVEVVAAYAVRLSPILPEEVAREGFPDWTPRQFVEFFCQHMKCSDLAVVTRIEWRYLDGT